jgi:hypothetical protein
MIGRRAMIGLSLLSALLFCAFAAQSASAAKSVNTTMVTCVKDPLKKGDFIDAHCDTTGKANAEEFKHEPIALDTTTEIEVTNNAVTESTKKSEPAVLKGKIAGAKTTIECTVVKNNAKESTLHNVQTEVEKVVKHTLTGQSVTEFSTCNVKELTKCIVAEPIVASANVEGVEGLKGPKGEANAMGLEFKGKGAEETYTEIEFKNKGAEVCNVGGKKFPVKGSAIATCGPTTESAGEADHCGATLVFTPKFEMEKLKFGPEAAEFSSIVTPSMAGGGSPISTTTTTVEP